MFDRRTTERCTPKISMQNYACGIDHTPERKLACARYVSDDGSREFVDQSANPNLVCIPKADLGSDPGQSGPTGHNRRCSPITTQRFFQIWRLKELVDRGKKPIERGHFQRVRHPSYLML